MRKQGSSKVANGSIPTDDLVSKVDGKAYVEETTGSDHYGSSHAGMNNMRQAQTAGLDHDGASQKNVLAICR